MISNMGEIGPPKPIFIIEIAVANNITSRRYSFRGIVGMVLHQLAYREVMWITPLYIFAFCPCAPPKLDLKRWPWADLKNKKEAAR
jgi:hypothetical protein